MTDECRTLDAMLRSRLAWFARAFFPELVPGEALMWNWHLDAVCHQLDRVLAGETTRLIIEVPPRSLKSVLGSVMFPAYVLGRDPGRKIIAASYSLDLARKHANDCRAVMRSARYQRLFPGTALGAAGKDTEADFYTSVRGYRYSTSPSGTLTGRGGDLLVLDDIMSAGDAASDARREAVRRWYANTAYSRLNNKQTGAIVVITQRLHVDDLVGMLREQGGWQILSLPAVSPSEQCVDVGLGRQHVFRVGDLLHPSREPQATLDDLKRTLGSNIFSAQYLQQPVPVDGDIVHWAWFQRYDSLPARGATIVQSWDIGMTDGDNADWSVCSTWAVNGSNYYLVDVARGRWSFPVLLRRVAELARQFAASSILIEDMVTGTALIQQLRAQQSARVPCQSPAAPPATSFRDLPARRQRSRPVMCSCRAQHRGSPNCTGSSHNFRTVVTTIRSTASHSSLIGSGRGQALKRARSGCLDGKSRARHSAILRLITNISSLIQAREFPVPKARVAARNGASTWI